MRKNNSKNPAATFLAFTTLAILWRAVKRMIKKYHKKQELFFFLILLTSFLPFFPLLSKEYYPESSSRCLTSS